MIDDLMVRGQPLPGGLTISRDGAGRIVGVVDPRSNRTVLSREDCVKEPMGSGREMSVHFRYLLVLEGNDVP